MLTKILFLQVKLNHKLKHKKILMQKTLLISTLNHIYFLIVLLSNIF